MHMTLTEMDSIKYALNVDNGEVLLKIDGEYMLGTALLIGGVGHDEYHWATGFILSVIEISVIRHLLKGSYQEISSDSKLLCND